MTWIESAPAQPLPVTPAVDVVFRIVCPHIGEDHAAALSGALSTHLAWLEDEPCAGLHPIHGAATGNGWQRPERASGGDGVMHLSRRARLVVRTPRHRADEVLALRGRELDVGGHALGLGEARIREMLPESTQRARHVRFAPGESEADFTARMVQDLAAQGIAVRKLLCGRSQRLRGIDGEAVDTRSVLLADLSTREALLVQCFSLGGGGHLGCGLFEPHRGIAATGGPGTDSPD